LVHPVCTSNSVWAGVGHTMATALLTMQRNVQSRETWH